MKVLHSILVVCFNQEKLISDCLESIITQSMKPYEVIVVDDCSADNTWSVVNYYIEKYPLMIKGIRNETNLGVFQNVNKAKLLPTGNFVNFVSGDDILPSGILERYTNYINDNKIDLSEPILILTDCYIKSGNDMRLIKNEKVMKYSAFENVLLNCLWTWDTGMSGTLLKKMSPLREDIGYQADLLWHLDKVASSSRYYYLPFPGYIYRSNIGVTKSTPSFDHFYSKKKVVSIIIEKYGNKISSKAYRYLSFDDSRMNYIMHPSFTTYIKLLYSYVKTGGFRHNNVYRHSLALLLPYTFKQIIKSYIK